MTKEQIKRALEIGEEEMCSPEMIEHCVFCREFMTPAMEALREIDQLMDSMEKRQLPSICIFRPKEDNT